MHNDDPHDHVNHSANAAHTAQAKQTPSTLHGNQNWPAETLPISC